MEGTQRTASVVGSMVAKCRYYKKVRRFNPFSKIQDEFPTDHYKMIVAMGFVDMNDMREHKYNEAKQKGYDFISYLHDSVLLHDDVVIEENCIILDHVSIHPGCKIEQGTFISSNVNIGHDCVLSASNWFNSGVSIAGGCNLGAGCFMGVNASITHGVVLGDRTFVSANTLINKNTKNDEVYLSPPGKLFRLNSKSFLKFSRMFD